MPEGSKRRSTEVELIQEKSPDQAESAETNEMAEPETFDINRMILDQEISGWVKKLVEEIGGPDSGPLTQFTGEFRDKYLDYKINLAKAAKAIEKYLFDYDTWTIVSFDENFKDELTELLPPGFYEKIRAQAEIFFQQVELEQEIIASYSSQEIFESITGGKPKGKSLYFDRYKNAIVSVVFDTDDFNRLYYAKEGVKQEDKSGDVGGFYQHQEGFVFKNGPARNESDEQWELPLIVINLSSLDDKMEDLDGKSASEAFEAAADYYLEEMKKEWDEAYADDWDEELLAKTPGDYEYAEDIPGYDDLRQQAYEVWLAEQERISGGFLSKLLGNWPYDHYEEWQVDFAREIMRHELQHFKWKLPSEKITKKLEIIKSKAELQECLRSIYKDYLDGLADEVLAWTATGGKIGFDDFMNQDEEGDDDYDDESSDEGEEENHKPKEIKEEKMKKFGYFYPTKEKEEIFESIMADIGTEKFKEWEVERLWQLLEKRFGEALKRFEEIGDFIRHQQFKHAKALRYLFQLEPGENWPRLYNWLKKNPELLKRVEEIAKY